jgi:hypothetical protein
MDDLRKTSVKRWVALPAVEIEMPPFVRINLKAEPCHGGLEQSPVVFLSGGGAKPDAVRSFGEIIEIGDLLLNGGKLTDVTG